MTWFILGFICGGLFGAAMMAILQIQKGDKNNDNP